MYSNRPAQLAKAEQWIGCHVGKWIRFAGKCRMQERTLLNAAVAGDAEGVQPVQGVLARLNDMCSFLAVMEFRQAVNQPMGKDGVEGFCSGAEGVSEYYICGGWVRIHVFQGDLSAQLKRLEGSLGCILYDADVGRYRENAPQNSQNYWNWYKALRQARMEAKGLDIRGFIPDLRGLKPGLIRVSE
jgi:hypothetical protein